MTEASCLICSSEQLLEKGRGVRFNVMEANRLTPAFAIRFGGIAYAYLNRCAHVPMELDWAPGDFFDGSGLHLMCATHGAVYEPESGRCAGGPCQGGRLRSIAITERNGQVFWQPDQFLKPAADRKPLK